MKIRRLLFSACLTVLPCALFGQGLTPATLLKQPADAWPTYNGDYSGRRFSPLTQINASNVHTLSLAWATRFSAGGGGGRGGAGAAPAAAPVQIKSTPLMVNGILYFSSPNNVWAADARTGRELWHYQYPPNTGSTIGNRGVGMYGNWLFFETPDSNLVSVDAQHRQGALEGAHRRPEAGLHVDRGAGGGRQSHPGGHRRRPSGQSRLPGVSRSGDRRTCSGNGGPRRARANRASRPGPTNTPRRTAPGRPGSPGPTIPSSTCTSSARAIRIR